MTNGEKLAMHCFIWFAFGIWTGFLIMNLF